MGPLAQLEQELIANVCQLVESGERVNVCLVLPNVFVSHSSLSSMEGRACVIVRCYDSQNRAVLNYLQVLSTVNF